MQARKQSTQAKIKAATEQANLSLFYISLQLNPAMALPHSTILRLYSMRSDISLDLKRLRTIVLDDR